MRGKNSGRRKICAAKYTAGNFSAAKFPATIFPRTVISTWTLNVLANLENDVFAAKNILELFYHSINLNVKSKLEL